MDVSQPRPRQVLPPHHPPRHHHYSLLHLSSGWVAQVDIHDSYATLRRPSPSPKTGSRKRGHMGRYNGGPANVLPVIVSMYSGGVTCLCMCVCVNKCVFAQQGFEASTHNVAFIYYKKYSTHRHNPLSEHCYTGPSGVTTLLLNVHTRCHML